MRYYFVLEEFLKDFEDIENEEILVGENFIIQISKLNISEYKRIREKMKEKNIKIRIEKGTLYGKSKKRKGNSL